MDIYLLQNNTVFRFPVLPSEYSLSGSQNNTSENVSRLGEVTILGKGNLKTISLSSFFPAQKYRFNQYSNISTPEKSVDVIDGMKSGGVLRLVMTGQKNINMLCTIEDFEWGENDATHDINFTINFKEYIFASGDRNKKNNSLKTVIHTVKKGETLQSIAKAETGNSGNWKKIKTLNNLDNTNLKVGEKLVIRL